MLRAALSLAHYTNKSELAVEFDFLEQFQEHERCGMTGQERESQVQRVRLTQLNLTIVI
jgi:hypothetical protein